MASAVFRTGEDLSADNIDALHTHRLGGFLGAYFLEVFKKVVALPEQMRTFQIPCGDGAGFGGGPTEKSARLGRVLIRPEGIVGTFDVDGALGCGATKREK